MKVKTGYLYHIKDEYFDLVNDEKLMQNHEKGKKRPTYFTIKEKDILWFIPVSSKIEKYSKIIEKKVARYGFCNTIIIRKKRMKMQLYYFKILFLHWKNISTMCILLMVFL